MKSLNKRYVQSFVWVSIENFIETGTVLHANNVENYSPWSHGWSWVWSAHILEVTLTLLEIMR